MLTPAALVLVVALASEIDTPPVPDAEAAPVAVPESDPPAVPEADPVSVPEPDPVAVAEPDPIAVAEAALQALDYRGALAAADRAFERPGNGREQLLRIHELRGLIAAAMGDEGVAGESFRALLSLSPDYVLPREFSPRIRELFDAAKAEVTRLGPLQMSVLPDAGDGQLRVTVVNDPFGLARRFRFHFAAEDGHVVPVGGELVNGIAILEPPSTAQAGWWGELLGAHDGVLTTIGSQEEPLKVPLALLQPRVELVVPDWKLRPEEPKPTSALERVPRASWGLWAGSGASLIGGGVLGAMAQGGRRELQTTARDGSGRVVGLTQREAFAADAQIRGQAMVANVLFGAAVALALGGGGVWWWDATAREGSR